MDEIKKHKRILQSAKNIAVVGLSANPSRPSYFAAIYLLQYGYNIIPVNPRYDEVLGQECYPSLLDIPEEVDVVDIFRKPEDVVPIVEEAIKIGAKVVWMQLGIVNEEAAEMARKAGLEVVMDRCMKIEHARVLAGGLHLLGITTGIISSRKREIV